MRDTIDMAREAGIGLEDEDHYQVINLAELEAFEALVRNATLDEIASKIALMPFGDTAASFAVWIREQKK